jgi:hypothetical protein
VISGLIERQIAANPRICGQAGDDKDGVNGQEAAPERAKDGEDDKEREEGGQKQDMLAQGRFDEVGAMPMPKVFSLQLKGVKKDFDFVEGSNAIGGIRGIGSQGSEEDSFHKRAHVETSKTETIVNNNEEKQRRQGIHGEMADAEKESVDNEKSGNNEKRTPPKDDFLDCLHESGRKSRGEQRQCHVPDSVVRELFLWKESWIRMSG